MDLVCSLAIKQILLRALSAVYSLPRLFFATGYRAVTAPEEKQRHRQAFVLKTRQWEEPGFGARNHPLLHLLKLHIYVNWSRVALYKWPTVLSPSFHETLAGDLIGLDTHSSYQPSLFSLLVTFLGTAADTRYCGCLLFWGVGEIGR